MKFLLKALLALVLIFFSHLLQAQNQDSIAQVEFKKSFWFGFGFGGGGAGSGSNRSGLGNEVDLKFNISNRLYMALSYEGIEFESGFELEQLKSISFRIGALYKSRAAVLYYGLGASYLSGSRFVPNKGIGRSEPFSVASLTPQLGFLLSPGHIGVGLSVYAQINKEHSYAGFSVKFGLGVINERKKNHSKK